MVHACLELSFSDANKAKLAVPRVRDLLIEVIRNALPEGDGVDLYNSEVEVRKSAFLAAETLLQLSFCFEDAYELIAESGFLSPSCGLERVLSAFASHTDAELNGTTVGLLLSRLVPKQMVIPSRENIPDNRRHIMISYCWDKSAKPTLVSALAEALRERGYEVWRDIEGSAYVAPGRVDKAVEASYAVVFCFSKEYFQSPSCRMEGAFAYETFCATKNRMVYLMMDEDILNEFSPRLINLDPAVPVASLCSESQVEPCAEVISNIVGERAKRCYDIDDHMQSLTLGNGSTETDRRYKLIRFCFTIPQGR